MKFVVTETISKGVRAFPQPLSDKVAVVTGATSGVGRSIALSLAEAGADVALVGRRETLLHSTANRCGQSGSRAVCYRVDLLDEEGVEELANNVNSMFGGADILVHAAGVIGRSDVMSAATQEFDRQYQSNVRAPFAVTRLFLPSLIARRGHVVFINSTVGLVGSPGISQYSATKHALRGFADSLREEVSSDGVRVTSVFLGRTATPMQAQVHEWEGRPYVPEQLIQPEQVASIVLNALTIGHQAEVTDIRIRPTIRPETAR